MNGWKTRSYRPLYHHPCVWINPWFLKYIQNNCFDSPSNQGYRWIWQPINKRFGFGDFFSSVCLLLLTHTMYSQQIESFSLKKICQVKDIYILIMQMPIRHAFPNLLSYVSVWISISRTYILYLHRHWTAGTLWLWAILYRKKCFSVSWAHCEQRSLWIATLIGRTIPLCMYCEVDFYFIIVQIWMYMSLSVCTS